METNDLRKAAEMALEALEIWEKMQPNTTACAVRIPAIQALRQALEEPEQEQKTPLKVLNLTVFTENRLRNGRVYDVETLQAMTNRDILAIPDMGKKALKEVMEALDVYAVNISQERVDETAKREHEPIAFVTGYFGGHLTISCFDTALVLPDGLALYTAPPKRKWVGLTDEEIYDYADIFLYSHGSNYGVKLFGKALEATLKEKNGG